MGRAYGSWHSTSSANDLRQGRKHMNCLLQNQHNVCQHEKKKTKYEKYQAGLTALRNLIKTNI